MTSVGLNGRDIRLVEGLVISYSATNGRLGRTTVDGSTPGGRELLNALLLNTNDGEPTAFTLTFDDSVKLELPRTKVRFNHSQLVKALSQ